MKNKLILLIALLLLSGCTVEYNANITRDKVIETATINEIINADYPVTAYINDQGSSETNDKIEGIDYYDILTHDHVMTYKYTFPFDRYTEGTGVNYCYKEVHFTKIGQKEYKISTSNYNSCIDFYNELEEINVNLTFSDDFAITSHNADKINDHTYTWVINRTNYQNKTLEISYLLKDAPTAITKNNSSNWIIILISFLGLSITLAVIIKFKNKKWKGK